MRRYTLILLVAVICRCIGCQSVTGRFKKSMDTVANDYHRVTTGASSSYIAGQRLQR
jgi:hypothetical protein